MGALTLAALALAATEGFLTMPLRLVRLSTTGITSSLSSTVIMNSNLLPGPSLDRFWASACRVTCSLLIVAVIMFTQNFFPTITPYVTVRFDRLSGL